MCVVVDICLQTLWVAEAVRVGEESQGVLSLKDTAACLIYICLKDASLAQETLEILHKRLRTHVHICAGLQRESRCCGLVADTMDDSFIYGAVVCDNETIIFPLITQQMCEEPVVACGRYAVDNIER